MPQTDRDNRVKIQLLIEVGRYREALHSLSTILARTPDDYFALCEKAICHLRLGEFQSAYDATKTAITLQPDAEWGYRVQSHVFTANGESGRALEAAAEAFRLGPAQFETTQTLFYAQTAFGQFEDAAETLLLLLEISSDDADSHFAMGYLAFYRKDYDRAEHSFLETLRLVPEHVDALNTLGAVYLELANSGKGESYRKKAIEMFDRAVKTEPTYELAQANIKVAAERPVKGRPWLVLGLFFFLISSPLQIFLYNIFTDQIDGQTSLYEVFSPLIGGPALVALNFIVIAVVLGLVGLRLYYLTLEDKTPILLALEKKAVWWSLIAFSSTMLLLYIPAAIWTDHLNSFPGIAARFLFVMLIAGGAILATRSALAQTD